MDQPQLMRLITNKQGIKKWKNLNVHNNLIDLQGPYLKSRLVAIDCENSDGFLFA